MKSEFIRTKTQRPHVLYACRYTEKSHFRCHCRENTSAQQIRKSPKNNPIQSLGAIVPSVPWQCK